MKIRLKIMIICLCISLTGCFHSNKYMGVSNKDPIHIQLAYQEMSLFAEKAKKLYNLELVKCGGGMMASIDYFSMTFIGKQQVNSDDARLIFISLSEEFIKQINHSNSLIPYLSSYPFTPKNLDLAISFEAIENPPFEDYVTNVGMFNSISKTSSVTVLYGRYRPETGRIEAVLDESYERAIGIVEHQRNLESQWICPTS